MKSLSIKNLLTSLQNLVANIEDGSQIVIPPDYSFVPMEITRALIRKKARDLRLVAAPQTGLQADILIGAGCVSEIEAAAVSLGELGNAPRFTEAIKAKKIELKDSTCPAIHAGLQASEKGIPFMPLRGIIGSDILKYRNDWKISENPFKKISNDSILLLPAIHPDYAIFHAPYADREGNIWIGRRRELALMSHAAKKTYVSVEEVRDTNLLDNEETAANALPSLYINGITICKKGSWPLGLSDLYDADRNHLQKYASQARSKSDFSKYLESYVFV
tara:strand:+ start:24720 stop:25547 length:828 start_codon:yes stop_codon:yes gene_type:complete